MNRADAAGTRPWRRLDMPEFFAPAPLAAVALMALNDHVLKAYFHNALTGKLSDLAACFFLPALVSGVLGLMMPTRPTWRLTFGALITAATFVLIELSDTGGGVFALVTTTLGAPLGIHRVVLTRDLTDLFALAMIPLGVLHAWWTITRKTASGGTVNGAGVT